MPAFHPLEKFSLSLCILLGVCYGCIMCSIDFLQRRYLMADISFQLLPSCVLRFFFSQKICSFSGLLLVGETKMVLLCILYGVGLICIHNILCFLVLEADCFRVGTHHFISLSVLIIFSDLGGWDAVAAAG
jgi:hypothetical protein